MSFLANILGPKSSPVTTPVENNPVSPLEPAQPNPVGQQTQINPDGVSALEVKLRAIETIIADIRSTMPKNSTGISTGPTTTEEADKVNRSFVHRF